MSAAAKPRQDDHDTQHNPMGTDGFEFVEYAHPRPDELHALFKLMGYAPVARHKTRKITVYRQGDINYLVNEESGTHGHGFVRHSLVGSVAERVMRHAPCPVLIVGSKKHD